jgi:VanZ family protein
LKFTQILKSWGPVVVWVALICFGSSDLMSSDHTSRFVVPFLHWLKPDMSAPTLLRINLLVRKAAHVTEYAILTGLFFRALRPTIVRFWPRAVFALVPALLLAPIDEFHQSFVRSRSGSPVDVLIDYCGAITGIVICRFLTSALRRREAASR